MLPTLRINIIAAIGEHNEIGTADNKLIWQIPEDMRYFKSKTQNHIVIMGRNTFESLPEKSRPLPGRTNIILTHDDSFFHPECFTAHNIGEALTQARLIGMSEKHIVEDVFVIGGENIYKQFLPMAEKLYITQIFDSCTSAHKFFPNFDPNKYRVKQSCIKSYENQGTIVRYIHKEFTRKN